MKFFCCNSECGEHYTDKPDHWRHKKLSFKEYLQHKKLGHDVYKRLL